MIAPRLVLAAALTALSLAAAANPRPGLDGADPRRAVNPRAAPWNAIGRFETEEGARCTGALIAPRLVLTAAHCLVDEARGRLVPPRSARFILGDGATLRGMFFRIGAGFIPARQEPWRADWAFVTLETEAPPGVRPLPLLREPPDPGRPLALAAWQHDRPGELSLDASCRALGLAQYGPQGLLIQHNCAGTFGSSGAPILALEPDGRWVVIGVQAKAALGQRFGVAVPAFTLPAP